MPSRKLQLSILSWVEIVVGAFATLGVVGLQVRMLRHAGGLWRDEAAMLHLAELPSLADNWSLIEFEAFPFLWYLVLRGWLALGFGASDFSVRVLGLLIVVGIVAALWWCARCFATPVGSLVEEDQTDQAGTGSRRRRTSSLPAVPLLSLALAGCCPVLYQVGGSLRAYGCGIILLLITLGAVWKLIQGPSKARAALAIIAAILSVQCLYYNAVLLLAILLPAIVLCLKQKKTRLALLVLSIGMLAAASLLPYLGVITRVHKFNMLVQTTAVEPLGLAENLVSAIDPDNAGSRWVWLIAGLMIVAAFLSRILMRSFESWGWTHDRLFIAGVVTALAIGLQFGFLWMLSYTTSSSGWYYLTLLVLVPVLLDMGIQVQAERHIAWRYLRLGLVVAVVPFASQSLWNATQTRMTNIDLIARQLREKVQPGDLVIVNPWWMGISFQRYYDGTAPWATHPAVSDHRAHRYDLLKEKMMEANPNAPLLELVEQTLRGRNRVWTIGPTYFVGPGTKVERMPPAPHPITGWREEPYQQYWRVELATKLQSLVTRCHSLKVESHGPVSRYEKPDLNYWEKH